MRCNLGRVRITTFTDSMYLYCFNSRQLFFLWDEWLFVNFFSFRYSQNTLWATFVAFLVFSLFFWLSKHANSLSERPAKRSAIFTQNDRKKEKNVVSFTHEQNIICSQTQLDDIAHEQTIICRQLISGHLMGSGPTKRKKNLQRMIIIRYSTSSSRWLGSAVETAFICRWMPFSVNKRNHCVREPILRVKTRAWNNTVNN